MTPPLLAFRLLAAALAACSVTVAAAGCGDDDAVKKPDAAPVRFALIGPKLGSLEPCGCTGGQLGGLSRLKTQLDILLGEDPSLLIVDAGELVKGAGDVERIRGDIAVSAYAQLPLSAIGLGPSDLADGAEEARQRALRMKDPSATIRFPTAQQASVVTNSSLAEPLTPEITARAALGTKAIVLSLLTPATGDPTAAIAAARAQLGMQRDPKTIVIAVFHGVRESARKLAREVPGLDLVVVTRGSGSPDDKPEECGGALLIHPGEKGRHIVDVAIGRKDGKVIADKFKVRPIVGDLPADETVEGFVHEFRVKLGEAGIIEKRAGKLPTPAGGYAGSAKCGECHPAGFKIWKESKHAKAVSAMLARNGHQDPECLKCHALGWYNDQGMGEITGYMGDPDDPLGSVGCESCHGPALKHTMNPREVKPVRDVMCQKCHDAENSPTFDRATFWKKIRHDKK